MAGIIRGRKAEPAPIVVSLVTGILAVKGTRYRINQGERVRASHPLAKHRPDLFIEDGLSDEEFHAARQAMLAAREAAA